MQKCTKWKNMEKSLKLKQYMFMRGPSVFLDHPRWIQTKLDDFRYLESQIGQSCQSLSLTTLHFLQSCNGNFCTFIGKGKMNV